MNRLLAGPLMLTMMAVLSTAAMAAQRSISIPSSTITANGTATNFGTSLALPSAGQTGGFISFVLPRDYKAGTVVKIRLTMYTSTAGACGVYMFPRQALRMRTGKPFYNSTERFTIVGGPDVPSPAALTILSKTFELRAPLGATFAGQLPGDAFELEVGRDGDQAADTCGNVFVKNAEIRYTRR